MQPFLAAEVILQGRRIDAGIGGDLAGRRLVEARFAKDTQRRSHDARAGLLASGVAAVLGMAALDPGNGHRYLLQRQCIPLDTKVPVGQHLPFGILLTGPPMADASSPPSPTPG